MTFMGKWFLNCVYLLMIFLGIGNLKAPEKSKASRIIAVLLIILSGVSAIVTNFYSFAKDDNYAKTGVLKPRVKNSKVEIKYDIQIAKDTQVTFCVKDIPDGYIWQPLGYNVPFSLKKYKTGLSVSAIIYSFDKTVIGKIKNNKWLVNPNNYFHMRQDASSLEILDKYFIPILQIEYVDEDAVRIGGIFHAECFLSSLLYSDFSWEPLPVIEHNLSTIYSRGLLIVGGNLNNSSGRVIITGSGMLIISVKDESVSNSLSALWERSVNEESNIPSTDYTKLPYSPFPSIVLEGEGIFILGKNGSVILPQYCLQKISMDELKNYALVLVKPWFEH
jgi:hypothetical protein